MRLSDYSNEHLVQAKATLFGRIVQEMCLNGGRQIAAIETCLAADPRSPFAPIFEKALDNWATKAASVGTSATWGAPLSFATELAASFMTLVEADSLMGKIPGLRKVPPGIPIPVGTVSGAAYWVGEGLPTPFTTLALRTLTVPVAKALAMIALSKETLRSGPGAAVLVRNDLAATVAAFVDAAFVDPALAAVTGVHPASITNGTVGLVGTGDPKTDVPALLAAFFAARKNAVAPVLLASPFTASSLALGKVDPGMPIVVSPHLGTLTIVLDAAAVSWAGTDDIAIGVSQQATVQVSDTPDSPVTASTTYVNLFQTDAVGVRAEWFVSWARADVTAVKYSAPA